MIDFDRIVGFEWDEGNDRKSATKHSVGRSEAEEVFFNQPLLFLPDDRHSEGEIRIHALGRAGGGRKLHITYTLRRDGSLIRVISARDMSRKERAYYDDAS